MSLSERFIEEVLASEVNKNGLYSYGKNHRWSAYQTVRGFYAKVGENSSRYYICKEEFVSFFSALLRNGRGKFSGHCLYIGVTDRLNLKDRVSSGLTEEGELFTGDSGKEFLSRLDSVEIAINKIHEFMGLKHPEISFQRIEVLDRGPAYDDEERQKEYSTLVGTIVSVKLAPFWLRNPVLLYTLADHVRTGADSTERTRQDLIKKDVFLNLFKDKREIRKMFPVENRKDAWNAHILGKGPLHLLDTCFHEEDEERLSLAAYDYNIGIEDIKVLFQRYQELLQPQRAP